MAKNNFSYKLWQWVLNLIILVPVIALGGHFVADKLIKNDYELCIKKAKKLKKLEKLEELETNCSDQKIYNNTSIGSTSTDSYQDREWRRLLVTEILVILGSMLKLVLRHRKNSLYIDNRVRASSRGTSSTD